jgi:hypothetical protein
MRFLFWNIKKNPVGPILSEIVRQHDVEVLILAECLDQGTILVDLNATTKNLFHLTDSQRTRVVIYTRFPPEYIKTAHSDKFFTIRRIFLPEKREIRLAAMHLESKLYRRDIHLWSKAKDVSAKIRQVESELAISRTVLVGDLNMNPFEMGVIQADGLHAVMTQAIARKRDRRIGDKVYPYFYNPMWGRFGDTTKGPPGTYYSTNSSLDEYFWHTFDQVMIRPDLIDSFDQAKLQVLTDCGGIEFLKESGKPDHSRASDHLPLLFDLEI